MKSDLEINFVAALYLTDSSPPPPPPSHTVQTYVYIITRGGGGVVVNKREGERGNRGECRLKSWVENTIMTECTQEIGYLQS
jgi:hypothetical protein